MNNFKKEITLNLFTFGSNRYLSFQEAEKISEELFRVTSAFFDKNGVKTRKALVFDEEDSKKLFVKNDKNLEPAIFFPLSGGSQTLMLHAYNYYDVLGFGVTYTDFFIDKYYSDICLYNNAAPALMDTFAVIKREKKYVKIITDLNDTLPVIKAKTAIERLRNSTLLRIGEIEPWVISSSKKFDLIKNNFDINVISIPQVELEEEYKNISEENIYSEDWLNSSDKLIEVSDIDVIEASKLTIAIKNLINKYYADGVCISCFNLLKKINMTACLSLSIFNDDELLIGGCEGDIDTAITLMIMKALSGKPGWIANPMIEKNNMIRLSHCTAPRYEKKYKYELLKHHESGIGVSPRVYMPISEIVTLSRIGNDFSKFHYFTGITQNYNFKNTCRTQALVQIDNFDEYIKNVLGCHLVLTFGNYSRELKYFAQMLHIDY